MAERQQQTLQITPEQSKMLQDAVDALKASRRELSLIFAAIAAGHGVSKGQLISLDPATHELVVEA